MPRFILSYDLKDAKDSDHANFKSELITSGWNGCASVSNVLKKLPETTMLGNFDLVAIASGTVTSAEKAANVTVSRYVVGELTGVQKGKLPDDCDP
ncbi:hypothetical protein [Agrobacterium burrii]|uniref:Uncharacterized protein n=1 Tax=Agrobacterium burrii TaxID=2815339 RepID=A0ABS3EDB5_9HYPH|nr:hypothetical protein [Agrobacterium burrii]MBO0129945.1 hypothetical protein [Agrobacterium burrii]